MALDKTSEQKLSTWIENHIISIALNVAIFIEAIYLWRHYYFNFHIYIFDYVNYQDIVNGLIGAWGIFMVLTICIIFIFKSISFIENVTNKSEYEIMKTISWAYSRILVLYAFIILLQGLKNRYIALTDVEELLLLVTVPFVDNLFSIRKIKILALALALILSFFIIESRREYENIVGSGSYGQKMNLNGEKVADCINTILIHSFSDKCFVYNRKTRTVTCYYFDGKIKYEFAPNPYAKYMIY